MLCLATTGIWAQSTEFGIKGGLNYGSTGDIDNFSDAREDFPDITNGERKAGYHFGIFANFGISSFLCGLSGALWAYAVLGTVEPQAFDIARSFEILFMIFLNHQSHD